MAIQRDGKNVVGSCWNATNTGVCVVRHHINGATDVSFNGGDGSNVAFCASRLDAAGQPDPTFEQRGVVVGRGTGQRSAENAGVVVLPDEKFVLFGSCSNGDRSDFCLTRQHPNGSLDSTFIFDGANSRPVSDTGSDRANAAVVPLDGKILVAGQCDSRGRGGARLEFCVARVDPSGSIDATFLDGGTTRCNLALLRAATVVAVLGSCILQLRHLGGREDSGQFDVGGVAQGFHLGVLGVAVGAAFVGFPQRFALSALLGHDGGDLGCAGGVEI